jgi:XTP/dITP diphosphohydrolase
VRLSPGRLVIATHNAGKVAEIRALVAPLGFDPVSAGELGLAEPAETGTSFAENAAIKARAACEASGLPALADDSGLSVAALGGMPGVWTADWAEQAAHEGGPGRDWYMAMGKVEGKLAALGADADRSAFFTAMLCLALPDGAVHHFEGQAHGSLVWPPRGTRGFGYDPVFVPAGDTRTYGEMEPVEKHGISHRAAAFAKFVAWLRGDA